MLFSRKDNLPAEIRLSLPYQPKEMSGLIRIEMELVLKSDVPIERGLLRVTFDDGGATPCERTLVAEQMQGRPFSAVIN